MITNDHLYNIWAIPKSSRIRCHMTTLRIDNFWYKDSDHMTYNQRTRITNVYISWWSVSIIKEYKYRITFIPNYLSRNSSPIRRRRWDRSHRELSHILKSLNIPYEDYARSMIYIMNIFITKLWRLQTLLIMRREQVDAKDTDHQIWRMKQSW